MSSKQAILLRIEQNKPVSIDLPKRIGNSTVMPGTELKDDFINSLIKVGASVVELDNESKLIDYIKSKHREGIDFGESEVWSKYTSEYPINKLEKIDTIILSAWFGVAENGAIWLDESKFPNRLLPFISQKLIIKLSKEDLVQDMHRAYQILNMEKSGFGVFISGPSKTADIEQSLVYGAHGAKEMLVILF